MMRTDRKVMTPPPYTHEWIGPFIAALGLCGCLDTDLEAAPALRQLSAESPPDDGTTGSSTLLDASIEPPTSEDANGDVDAALDAGADMNNVTSEGDAAVSSSDTAAETPRLKIRAVASRGPLCKVAGTVSQDGSRVAVKVSGFDAEVDQENQALFAECYVDLDVETPPGYTYAITHASARGSFALSDGAVGRLDLSYSELFSTPHSGIVYKEVKGLFDGSISVDAEFEAKGLRFRSCDRRRHLVVDIGIYLDVFRSAGRAAASVTDLEVLELGLRPCPAKEISP